MFASLYSINETLDFDFLLVTPSSTIFLKIPIYGYNMQVTNTESLELLVVMEKVQSKLEHAK